MRAKVSCLTLESQWLFHRVIHYNFFAILSFLHNTATLAEREGQHAHYFRLPGHRGLIMYYHFSQQLTCKVNHHSHLTIVDCKWTALTSLWIYTVSVLTTVPVKFDICLLNCSLKAVLPSGLAINIIPFISSLSIKTENNGALILHFLISWPASHSFTQYCFYITCFPDKIKTGCFHLRGRHNPCSILLSDTVWSA